MLTTTAERRRSSGNDDWLSRPAGEYADLLEDLADPNAPAVPDQIGPPTFPRETLSSKVYRPVCKPQEAKYILLYQHVGDFFLRPSARKEAITLNVKIARQTVRSTRIMIYHENSAHRIYGIGNSLFLTVGQLVKYFRCHSLSEAVEGWDTTLNQAHGTEGKTSSFFPSSV